MNIKLISTSILLISLTGCAAFRGGFDGVGGETKFSCKAPDGVMCDSMSGVMANLNANNLPSQQVKHTKQPTNLPTQEQARTRATAQNAMPVPQYTGAPLIQQPTTLRVWVAPWESSDRTLFDQQYFYVVINNWDWQIEHNKRRVMEAYAPIGGGISPYANVNPTSDSGSRADPHNSQSTETPVAIEPNSDEPFPTSNSRVQSQGNQNTALTSGINMDLKNLDNVDISKFTR